MHLKLPLLSLLCALLLAAGRETALAAPGKMPKAHKGFASIIFFYFGDSKFQTLGQETVKLKLAMEEYEYKVLLKHDTVSPFWDLSEKDEKLADIKAAPTEGNLIKYLEKLADDGYIIDLWIFSHGSRDDFRVSTGTHGSKGGFSISDIENLVGANGTTGYDKLPLRLVYQVNCYGNCLSPSWIKVGAKVAVGSRYVNFYPNQFAKFAREWNDGKNVSTAADKSDTATSRTVVQTYILGHAKGCKDDWGGCPFPNTVLGDHDCSKSYFVSSWLSRDEWQKNKSGKENMNYSSEMLIKGDGKMTIKQKPSWN